MFDRGSYLAAIGERSSICTGFEDRASPERNGNSFCRTSVDTKRKVTMKGEKRRLSPLKPAFLLACIHHSHRLRGAWAGSSNETEHCERVSHMRSRVDGAILYRIIYAVDEQSVGVSGIQIPRPVLSANWSCAAPSQHFFFVCTQCINSVFTRP